MNSLCTTPNKWPLLGRAESGLLVVHMNKGYWFPTRTRLGVLHIGPSPRDRSLWALWLGDTLVGDGYGEPEEAALRAHKKDFPDSSAVDLLRGLSIPDKFGPLVAESARTASPDA